MPASAPLTEAQLHSFLGPVQFQRAEGYLAAGKLIGRYWPDEGGVAALWDWSPKAYSVALVVEGNQLYSNCECGHKQGRTLCDHVATLLLAWVRQPNSFTEEADLEAAFLNQGEALDAGKAAISTLDRPPGPPPALAGLALPMIEGTEALRLAPPDTRGEFLQLLADLNAAALRALAGRLGLTVAGRSREALLDSLAEALSRPAVWGAAWDKLSPAARLVLAILPFRRQPTNPAQVSTVKLMIQTLTPLSANQFETALQELSAAGLVFVDRYGGLDCPRALPASLPPAPGFLTPVKPGTENTLRALPAPGPLDFALFATRLLLVLQAEGPRLRARPALAPHPLLPHLPSLQGWPFAPAELDALAKEPNPAGAAYRQNFTVPPAPSPLTDEARTAVSRALGGGDLERLDFALRLLAFLNLVELTPGQPVRVPDTHLRDFLQMSTAQRLMPLFNAWLALTTWTEFDRLAARRPPIALRHPGGAYQSNYTQLLAQLALARLGIVHQVRQAPPGVWSEVSALAARARGLNAQGYLFPTVTNDWYPDWNKRRPNLTQSRDWDAIYGPYVEAVLTGPLHWLGLVELAFSKEQLRGFRLSPLGAFVFRHTGSLTLPPAPVTGPALAFQPDGSLSLRAEAAGSDLLTLLSWLGELQGGARGELRYTLTAAGASRAFEAGLEVDQILATLRQAAGSPPPRALAESLRRWRENFGSVQIYARVALLELADDYALAELLAGTSLSQYLLYRFSPRLAALRPEGLEALQAELEQKGYTPKVTEPQAAPSPEPHA
jgi:hypothetical protein